MCMAAQVRNQRNRFVALIATARQAGTEMTDRLRLLSSEQEILTAEVASKAHLLEKVSTYMCADAGVLYAMCCSGATPG